MALFDRLAGLGEPKISVHSFCAAIRFAARGKPGFTVASIVSTFGLTPEEQTTLQALADRYVGLNASGRNQWIEDLEGTFILAEDGLINEAQAKNILGF